MTATLARDILEQEQDQSSSASQDKLFNVGLFLWPAKPYGLVITACKPGVCVCALMVCSCGVRSVPRVCRRSCHISLRGLQRRWQPPYKKLMARAFNFENLRFFKKAQFPFPPRTLKLVLPPILYDVDGARQSGGKPRESSVFDGPFLDVHGVFLEFLLFVAISPVIF